MEGKCILCDEGIDEDLSASVTRGLEMLRSVSLKRKDGIADKLKDVTQIQLHVKCRKKYTSNVNRVSVSSSAIGNAPKRLMRSDVPDFDFKTCCLYCGEIADEELYKKHPERSSKICQVEYVEKIESIRTMCTKRCDQWGEIVLNRMNSECDLIAADAQYHKNCDARFFVIRSTIPGKPPEKVGRHIDETKFKAFNKLCSFLDDNDDCQYLLSELMEMLVQFNTESEKSYSEKHLRELLTARYGDMVLMSPSIKCFGTVVSFRPVASRILTDSWYTNRKKDVREEKKRILDAAITILQEEIRSEFHDCGAYPTCEEISEGGEHQVGEMLSYLLSGVMKPIKGSASKQKVLSVAHAIISSVRPRSFVSAVQVGIGVFLHRRFRSRHLINLLHSLGCSVSFSEVCKYEASVTTNTSREVDGSGFVQYVFDNADHNTRTVDGHGTFHVMGGVQCVTPASAVQTRSRVPRPKTAPKATVVGKFGFIPIISHDRPKNNGLNRLVMEDILSLNLRPMNARTASTFDWIWMAGPKSTAEPHTGSDEAHRTGWSGFMETAAGQRSYEKSAVIPLPFVNLQPSNPTSINSCLRFAAEECNKRQQKCIVTFDQPLFIKAMDIVSQADETDLLSTVIVRLGGFHLLMSYMGAVAKIMGGSGMEEMWEEVFAKNAVVHMVNGHAYARALRAHSLSQAAIAHVLLNVCEEEEYLSASDIQTLRGLYNDVFNSSCSEESILSKVEPILSTITSAMTSLEKRSRTSKLWLQYFRQISITHDFVRAERTGDWNLHLYSVQRMLSHLHAAGHVHYAKAAHLYLQNMTKLKSALSNEEYERFIGQGYFTVRRSDKFWCGVWTDMTIEQVLMRSMKVSGGLTQGRNMSDSVVARWICAMPGSLQVTEAVEAFAGVTGESSDQHASLSRSWQTRDSSDLKKFVVWLNQHSPFNKSEELVSLSTGIVADERVNCDSAEEIGKNSVREITGRTFATLNLKRKNQVFTLAAMGKTITVNKDPIVVNPNQLFHRIACVVRSESDLEECLQYELAPYPQSIFDSVGLRAGTKSKIIQVIDKVCKIGDKLPENPCYVLDGGDLLHRVYWPRPATYGGVCNAYLEYVNRNYGRNVTVVFDGYQTSTKDAVHNRRAVGKSAAKVEVTPSNAVTLPQEQFLSNVENKQSFLNLLSTEFKKAKIPILQASSDADVLVVETAKAEAESGRSVVVVGADSDLLVLVAALTQPQCAVYMLVPGNSNTARKVYCSRELHEGLGTMTKHLLFIHAFMGCDTTSAFYNRGPISGFNKLQQDRELQRDVDVFNNPNESQDSIAKAGEKFIVQLYGGKRSEELDKTRYKKYVQTVGKKSPNYIMNLASLPPTSAAARQHSLRVYHQVQTWKGNIFPAITWGWTFEQGHYRPVLSTLPPAPDSLLHLIRCGCKADCSRNCECRRSGLPCTSMCSECAGESCLNRNVLDSDDEDVDLEDNCEDSEDHDIVEKRTIAATADDRGKRRRV